MHFVSQTMNFVSKTMGFVLQTKKFVPQTMNFVSQTMNFVYQTMNFVSQTMNFVSQIMNFVSQTMNFVPQTMNFFSQTMNFDIIRLISKTTINFILQLNKHDNQILTISREIRPLLHYTPPPHIFFRLLQQKGLYWRPLKEALESIFFYVGV